MNPNYTEFKFPQIKAHPWTKVFSKRLPPDAVDLVRVCPRTLPQQRMTLATMLVHAAASPRPTPANTIQLCLHWTGPPCSPGTASAGACP
jgi:hypothetical protein